ncbi:LuxR C-terminal-related transcriptional regulator [Streptomyces sp. NPDC093544]|uniref:LuxR C-terminal-related transcriptional regulator n=1 Tax=Streptomyces sp. NPDC093544 TaxID=3155200 RepID=UPI003427458B
MTQYHRDAQEAKQHHSGDRATGGRGFTNKIDRCQTCELISAHPEIRLATSLNAALPRVVLLSNREMDVFHLLSGGLSNRELSRALHITERTAKAHVASIVQKLSVDSRLQACMVSGAFHAKNCPEGQWQPAPPPDEMTSVRSS